MTTSFINALGLTVWQAKPNFASNHLVDETLRPKASQLASTHVEEALKMPEKSAVPSAMQSTNEPLVVSPSDEVVSMSSSSASFVLVGSGLQSIWQQSGSVQWRLLVNIVTALGLPIESLRVFDPTQITTEADVQDCIDVVIDLGVERVFAFEENSLLIASLEEGVQVVFLPSLHEMTQRPEAKQEAFEVLSSVLAA